MIASSLAIFNLFTIYKRIKEINGLRSRNSQMTQEIELLEEQIKSNGETCSNALSHDQLSTEIREESDISNGNAPSASSGD